MAAQIIFTDLDGTLLNTQTYDYAAALPTLDRLKAQEIPVIPVTSKTRAEVATLMADLGLTDPFIVENGSAVFIPLEGDRFDLPPGEDIDGYRVLQLGCPYVVARAGLKALAQFIGRPLKGFGDWTVDQIQQMTGLSHGAAAQAKGREFTEPFMTPKNIDVAVLNENASELGFRVVLGGRFSHLIGSDAGKGNAIAALKNLYQAGSAAPLTTIGLGNSPNDLSLLESVDHPIVVPEAGGPHPQLAARGWAIAPAPAPEGWAQAIDNLLA
ncbi:haloacid dehalogenase [filamentous cyanobacterium CCP5]|nr:haloacid dehalogenase [filamentous cyanobacterium CCP5]